MSDDAHDLGAEQSLLGSVLVAPDIAGPALITLPANVWWSEKHRTIAAVLTDRLRAGKPVDPQFALVDLMSRRGFNRSDTGPYLITLQARAWSPSAAGELADQLKGLAARRNLAGATTRTRQKLDESWSMGRDEAITEFTLELREALDEAERLAAGADAEQESTPLSEVLAGEDTHDWLVPGLLERAERIVITGSEGLGKSYLASQFAVCLASGLHPFSGRPLGDGRHALRVLVVDCENGLSQTRRRFRSIMSRVGRTADLARTNMRFELRPNGLNLLSTDAAWLERKVAANSPDLLVCGPLYRLHYANMNDETAARELVRVLDSIRTRHGCALLTEAHPGHSEDSAGDRRMRPAGSSLFLRWPEFGYGLRRAKGAEGEHPNLVDVVAWRGSREERHWPKQLTHGHFLPWEPADPEYWDRGAAA